MTVTYSDAVSSLLLRWRGSLYKTVWKELAVFLVLYYFVRLIYFYALDLKSQNDFEDLVIMFNQRLGSSFTLTFILGFYVSSIVTRWWNQVKLIVWPDQLVSSTCFAFSGDDRESRLSRHQISRYLIVTCVLAWREISIRVKKRFPTLEHLVKAGLLTPTELVLFNKQSSRWMVPLEWITIMIRKRMDKGLCPPPIIGGLINELAKYRTSFRELFCYDWICIPLVYSQVTAIATYSYFLLSLIAKQYLIPGRRQGYDVDIYFPIFTVMQFLFYVGWFKVGQELMKPFGEDDDDTELNFILDRHLKVVLEIADGIWGEDCPPLVEDDFWQRPNVQLMHTNYSLKIREHYPKSHVKMSNNLKSDMLEMTEKNITSVNCVLPKKNGKETASRSQLNF